MDSITQVVLGAAVGEAVLGEKTGRKGALWGGIIATIPDLDVALYLFFDKFEMLSIHRGLSHSILFSVVGAFVITRLLQKANWTKSIGAARLWLFSWLALFTHILLDTFTAYGTQLYLPFSDERVGLDSINVVDPVYTLPLIAGLVLSLHFFKNKPARPVYNRIGLMVSTLYLIVTLVIKSQVNQYFKTELAMQNIPYHALLTMPVGSAGIHWYGVAKTESGIYLHKYSVLKDNQPPFEYFPSNDSLLVNVNPYLVDRMKWFAKGFYTVEHDGEQLRFYNLQVDMRGIVKNGLTKAPTAGYFILKPLPDGSFEFSSGAHRQ